MNFLELTQALNCYLCTNLAGGGCGEYDFDPSSATIQNSTSVDDFDNEFDCSTCAVSLATYCN